MITKKGKILIGLAILALGLWAAYKFTPGLKSLGSTTIGGMKITNDEIDNVSNVEKLDLPSNSESTKVQGQGKAKIVEYAWTANLGLISANGGKSTKEGSIMEGLGVNLDIVRQDGVTDITNFLLQGVDDIEKGGNGDCDQCSQMAIVMGDGVPEFKSKIQKTLDSKYQGKYQIEVAGAVGISYGEDKLIAPIEWKTNPTSMIGKTISTAVADGDFILSLNFIGLQGQKLKINRDLNTYDPNAVNFHHCENGDFIKAGEELIKSQMQGWKVTKKMVNPDGTIGKEVQVSIDAASTWYPADKNVFNALSGYTVIASTKDFKNQMPATLLVIKQWGAKNFNTVSNILKGSYMGADQIKTNSEWKSYAYTTMANTYGETAEFWKLGYEGKQGDKNGVPYSVGGSRVFNLADAKQYFGLTDGVNRYKIVWQQVAGYLKELNPFDFNTEIGEVASYDKSVNLGYLASINLDSKVEAYKEELKETHEVFSNGNFAVNFTSGSDIILPNSYGTLNKVYGQLQQAEEMSIKLYGHTDKLGSNEINIPLSERRANAVAKYFIEKGLKKERVLEVKGYGSTKPVSTNNALNRRVEIEVLN